MRDAWKVPSRVESLGSRARDPYAVSNEFWGETGLTCHGADNRGCSSFPTQYAQARILSNGVATRQLLVSDLCKAGFLPGGIFQFVCTGDLSWWYAHRILGTE